MHTPHTETQSVSDSRLMENLSVGDPPHLMDIADPDAPSTLEWHHSFANISATYSRSTFTESELRMAATLYQAANETGEINTAAGNLPNGGWEAADHQIRIIAGEFEELRDLGIRDRNIHELRDGIGDLLFTVIGLAHRCGIDFIEDFKDVVRANQSKFDFTVEDANKTLAKYDKIGMKVHQKAEQLADGRTRWVTFSSEDQQDASGRLCPKGKWLKSHNFKDVNFQPLPEDNALNAPTEEMTEDTPANEAPNAIQLYCAALENNHPLRICLYRTIAAMAAYALNYLQDHGVAIRRTQEDESRPTVSVGTMAWEGTERFAHLLLPNAREHDRRLHTHPNIKHPGDLIPNLNHLTTYETLAGFLIHNVGIVEGALYDAGGREHSLNTAAAASMLHGDAECLYGWHANLAMAFYDAGTTWLTGQIIAIVGLESMFEINSRASLFDHMSDDSMSGDTRELVTELSTGILEGLKGN